MPRPSGRVFPLPLLLELLAHDLRRREDQPVPRHEGQVGVGDLVPDEVRPVLLLEVGVDDGDHAADLVPVAVEAAGEVLLGVVEREPLHKRVSNAELPSVQGENGHALTKPSAHNKALAHSFASATSTPAPTAPFPLYTSAYSPYHMSRANTQ